MPTKKGLPVSEANEESLLKFSQDELKGCDYLKDANPSQKIV